MSDASLRETLHARVTAGELVERLEDNAVRCVACGHRCLIRDGRDGICRIRGNRGGTLYVPRGYVAGLQVDPVEKKPFFHVLPGTDVLSFGMLGCDFHCGYCQNWITSQALRDESAVAPIREISAERLVEMAAEHGAPTVVSTYNEPLITSEWAREVFVKARAAGLLTGYVSNGNGTPEVLDYILPHLDVYKVDLKSFQDRNYRQLGGMLKHVLWTIEQLVQRGVWVEIVTLVVPGFNDDEGELREIAAFLAGVSADIPWHVTAFHADYKMTDPRDTNADDLIKAYQIGKDAGLRHVYAGNRPGRVADREFTFCPGCNTDLVRRMGFHVLANRVTDEGACPDCGHVLPGIWSLKQLEAYRERRKAAVV